MSDNRQRPQQRRGGNQRQPRSNYRKERSDKKSEEYEIRIRAGQSGASYINRAATLLLRDQQELEEGQTAQPALDFVVLKAAGPAINTALNVSGVIRRKIAGLHQVNRIINETVIDKYLPKETGLDVIEEERVLSVFEILLTRKPTEQEKSEAGYIGTLEEEITEAKLSEIVKQPRAFNRRENQRRPENRRGNDNRRRPDDRRDNNRRRPDDRRDNNRRRDDDRRDNRRRDDDRREDRRGGDRRRDDRRRNDRGDRNDRNDRNDRQQNRSNQDRKRSGEQKSRGQARRD